MTDDPNHSTKTTQPATPPAAKPGTPPPKAIPAASPLTLITGTEAVRVRGVKVCYWGKPFSGKTQYMLSWPGVVLILMDPDVETAFKINRQRKEAGLVEIPIIAPDLTTFHNRILPAIRSRNLDELIRADERFGDYTVRTLAFDSWTHYGFNVMESLNPGGGKADFAVWQAYKDRMSNTAEVFGGIRAGAQIPDKAGRFYNYVCSVHEREFMEEDGGKTKLVEIGPTVQGQFYDAFFSYFGAVLQCDVESGPKWSVRTKPNALRKSMGARLGPLPDTCDGHYDTLARHWGLTVEGGMQA